MSKKPNALFPPKPSIDFYFAFQLVTMVFILVQWLNENSVSVVNEKKVVGEDVKLKEGLTVDISTGMSKERLTIPKGEILKVFGDYWK